jgi:hypothetical protein
LHNRTYQGFRGYFGPLARMQMWTKASSRRPHHAGADRTPLTMVPLDKPVATLLKAVV